MGKIRKGPKIRAIEDRMGVSVEDMIEQWIADGMNFYEAIKEIFQKFGVYSATEQRSIRRSLWRFIKNYYPEYRDLVAEQGQGKQYLRRLGRYYGVPADEVVDYIIERNISLAQITREAVPEGIAQKVYVWLYNYIRNNYGKEIVRRLCVGVNNRIPAYKKVSPGYYGIVMHEWYMPLYTTAAATGSTPKLAFY